MMFKKSLIFLLALTANVLAIANPTIKIGSYKTELTTNYTKFEEPVVAVYNGSSNVTKQYSITYSIEGGAESVDSRGVRIVTDPATKTTVEKYFGNVNTGMAGEVTIKVIATPRAGGEALTSGYSFIVKAGEVKLTFAPDFYASANGHDGSLTLNTSALPFQSCYYIPSCSSVLPAYTLTTKNSSNKDIDITNYYDVTITYSGNDKITYNNNTITYSGLANQYWSNKTSDDINNEISALSAQQNILTYTFTPKSQYQGFYNSFKKVIDVNVAVKFGLTASSSLNKVHLSLPRALFTEDDVTGSEEDGYTIHVYKFGKSNYKDNDNYQYLTPNPAIITEGGAQLTKRVWDQGNWGDFKLCYIKVTDSTYYNNNLHGTLQPAGEPTGITLYDKYFQVGKPGLVKVAVYAALPGTYNDNGYGANLKAMYEPLKDTDGNPVVATGADGQQYTLYSEPVYFSIDVMKHVAVMDITPDPNTIVFAKGDKINIPERFFLSGHSKLTSNGAEGYLSWRGSATGEHFDYSFFVSDRMNNNFIRINNWPDNTNIHEEYVEASKDFYGTNVQVGDKILVDGEYVILDNDNIFNYSGRKLQEGDYEHGHFYNAMRDWGNESWNIEFLATGKYSIPYTFRPWDVQVWDDGGEGNEITFHVSGSIDTRIDLSYAYQIAPVGLTEFDEPTAKVIAPSMNNYDVTENYNLTYSIESDASTTGTSIDATTGNVTIGSKTGDVKIRVHADRKEAGQSVSEVFENPADEFYTIRLVDPKDLATWEVVSTDKGCQINTKRFANPNDANGRFHFLSAGNIYGGTIITGVPGISMTVGAPAADADDWTVKESAVTSLKCCQHEANNGVIAQCQKNVVLNEDGIPTDGSFYKFNPTVNGFLTVDAKFNAKDEIVLVAKDSQSGELLYEDSIFTATVLGDCTFKKPLIAGQTYYLFNADATKQGINLHGFAYQPAFIVDRNTTLAESTTGIEATTFMNGLSNSLPTLVNASNKTVSFEVNNTNGVYVTPTDYLTVSNDGKVEPKKMTMSGYDIFNLVINATVKSTDNSLGNCVNKTTYYKIKVIDIPTYSITSNPEDFDIFPGDEATTTNIKTDITMTFGGWDKTYEDKDDGWKYKSVAGAADRIGNEADYNTDAFKAYNKTIDGFEYFTSGNNNPCDEKNETALHNGKYVYASGTDFEDGEHNTTYTLPCYGNFVKFEPRESGTVLVYLVQNGCCSYHYGVKDIDKEYQIKWVPLYITDETGKPATMVNNFGYMSNFLPTGKDKSNAGSYTLGVSRCNKNEAAVEDAWNYNTSDAYGTSFDWSNFTGSNEDREALLAAWPAKGERESIIRLEDGGFVLPHKAYVRYAFEVKAGKTYFVFQPGSKFEVGGFSFVPTGYPYYSKYNLDSEENKVNMERNIDGASGTVATKSFTWNNLSNPLNELYFNKENLVIDINDCSDANKMKERTFTADTWNGICLPFSVSANELKRVFGEKYSLVTCDGYEDNKVVLNQHANKYIEAGRPYFIRPSKDGKMHFENISIEGCTFVKKSDGGYTSMIDPTRFDRNIGDEYTFKGIYTKEDLPAYSYFPAKDGLYKFGFNYSIGGYRSYLRISNSNSNSAKAIRFIFRNIEDNTEEDTLTGIMMINDSSNNINILEDNTTVYNMNGQIVGQGVETINSASHGVYIINGKKFIK